VVKCFLIVERILSGIKSGHSTQKTKRLLENFSEILLDLVRKKLDGKPIETKELTFCLKDIQIELRGN